MTVNNQNTIWHRTLAYNREECSYFHLKMPVPWRKNIERQIKCIKTMKSRKTAAKTLKSRVFSFLFYIFGCRFPLRFYYIILIKKYEKRRTLPAAERKVARRQTSVKPGHWEQIIMLLTCFIKE